MPTTLAFPQASQDVGWFDAYASGKTVVDDTAQDALYSAPLGSALSQEDANSLLIWAVFHPSSIPAPTEPPAGDPSYDVAILGWVMAIHELIRKLMEGLAQ